MSNKFSTMDSSNNEKVKEEIEDLLHPDEKIAKRAPSQWLSVRDFDDLSLGDHTCYYQFPYYRHGIIISSNGSIVRQLRYHLRRWQIDTEDIQYLDGKFFILDNGSKSEINLLKAEYSGPCLGSDTAVRRASIRQKEKLYNPITNFARAFPRWCKTGKGGLTSINDVQLNHSREVIHLIENLARGDHIAFDRGAYFHHALVISTNPAENTIEVIHYASNKGGAQKAQIMQQTIVRHDEIGTLYRLKYRQHTESEADLVVLRAELLMPKDPPYNIFKQNCEHFVTWCKTGIWHSGQVQAFAEYFMILLSALFIKLGPQVITRILSKSVAWVVDIFESFNVHINDKPVDIISFFIFCSIDIIYNIYDIINKYKKGELRGKPLSEEILKRVIRCIIVDCCVIAGSILGQLYCPKQLLGALLGGFCGLVVGEGINFLIQRGRAFIKSKQAKCQWEDSVVDGRI